MPSDRTCPECHAPLPPGAPDGPCPKCLLAVGIGSGSHPATQTVVTGAPQPATPPCLPKPGEAFGHYRIERLLGQGGMGAVYEAEHLELGRRVALKVLSHTINTPGARQRFLREGRLAAAINHPNSVYVFGTEEVGGTPVISMEFVPGGTLQDRVKAEGPLPVHDAVDAILQIIAGLEAAQAVGILHRDVKPSNCFIDIDGNVKVGDFGLSIPTGGREETALTAHGSFLGTPTFASPEQIRGDELTVRSDIYSVGVTLYYLLTGRAPHEADNLVRLLAAVLERPVESPAKWRPELSRSLCRIILRCLEKQPEKRFREYAELRAELSPYTSASPTPATLGFRLLAAVIDFFILSFPGAVVSLVLFSLGKFPGFFQPINVGFPWLAIGGVSAQILYLGLFEGLTGATPGKRICRLRVLRPDRSPAGALRGLARAALFAVPPVVPSWIYFLFTSAGELSLSSPSFMVASYAYYFIIAAFFLTVRKRNGFAALHDLLTNTRVIQSARIPERPGLAAVEQRKPVTDQTPTIGPYHVLDRLGRSGEGELLLGYDTRLLRHVWIRRLPAGAPPVPRHLRNLSRAGRLRWINGQRSPSLNYDAYEAAEGTSLARLLDRGPQSWGRIRFWLLDLAVELQAAATSESLPETLDFERVWISTGGRAKLLDFPAPSSGSPSEPRSGCNASPAPPDPVRFLERVAVAALSGSATGGETLPETPLPLPLHGRDWLLSLRSSAQLDALIAMLKRSLNRISAVTRARRFALLSLSALFPSFLLGGMFFGIALLNSWSEQKPVVSQLFPAVTLAGQLDRQKASPKKDEQRRQLETYIVGHLAPAITNAETWTDPLTMSLIKPRQRRYLEDLVAHQPRPTAEELARARKAIEPELSKFSGGMGNMMSDPRTLIDIGTLLVLFYAGVPALVAAVAFRGGLLMRLLGLAIVNRSGREASRLHALWRSVIAWSPFLIPAIVPIFVTPLRKDTFGMLLLLATLFAALAISSLLPQRSLQDRLARTWLVPR